MDHDDNLELKSEFLVRLYTAMDSKARELAPENIRKELAITQDGRI